MDRVFENEFCDTPFWDKNVTWYTSKPQFTPCFRDTALVWLPASLMVIVVLSETMNLLKAKSKGITRIPWNLYNSFRLSITILLLILKLIEFSSYVSDLSQETKDGGNSEQDMNLQETYSKLVISSFIVPIIQSICYVILSIIYYYQRKAGLHTSASIWFYLLVSVLCNSVDFYAVVSSIQPSIHNNVEHVIKYIYFTLTLILFMVECRGDTPIIKTNTSDPRPESPEIQASFFSSITFWWFNTFLIFGYNSRIGLSNLWQTLARDQANQLVPIFKNAWTSIKRKSSSRAYQQSNGAIQQFNNVMLVLLKLYWSKLLFAASLKLMQDALQFLTPMLLKKILAFMKSKDEPQWHGLLFAMLLLLTPTIQSLLLGNYFYHMQVVGIQVRTMIVGAVFRKALVLSGSSRLQSTSGEIVNLMAVDSQRFQDLLVYVNLIWSAPFQIIIAVFLLYRELGWPVFAGVGCMLLVLPSNAYLANRIKLSQVKVSVIKDERVKHMNEVLSGIKVVKLYAWENSFIANLFGFRDKELSYLRRILTLDALQTFLWQCSPFAVALVTFAVYVNADDANVLDAEKAFVSISLFNLLRFPLTMLPTLVTSLVLTLVSTRRLNKFFNNDELVKYVTRNDEQEAIAIEGGTLSWSQGDEQNDNRAILKDIDFHVKPKSFVAVVGQVASGKSSLLASILGEMHRIAGRFNICKSMSIAYVPQQAWIQNMTVKDNILFGSTFDEARYKRVLSACSLLQDLDTLPGGDQAEIGEKGINLSGGQKQRVSLARACYSNSDIFLMDDPLSALDSHVAKHVFEEVLSSSTGLLRDKTRVLATNSLFVLPYVDHIVVLEAGQVVESGTYQELMKIEGGHLSECMRQYSGNDVIESKDETSIVEGVPSLEQPKIVAAEDKLMKSVIPPTEAGRLIDIEKVETGSVNYRVYLSYFKAVSLFWLFVVAISLIASATFNVGTNLWLSIWSSDSDNPDKAHDTSLRNLRLIIYALLGGFQCLAVLIGSLGLSVGAVRASKQLHSSLLERVLHSPMTFFDTTPVGRILNRFAKDIDVVDSTIPGAFRSWMGCFLQIVSTMFVICYSFPTFFIIIVPLAIVYYLIQKVFIVTTRQLKRIESITRSPIYSHFNETLAGLSSIRAYDCTDRFICYSDNLVDRNQSCCYPNIIANRWLSIRLEFFGNLIAASAALFSVYYKGTINAGDAGLSISYSLSITQTLSWLVRMTSDLETNIVSVERILEYLANKQEDLWIKPERPSPNWPDGGAIQIEDYSTRYRNDTDLILKGVSINIAPREKVGIVGRTGSGKSSLSLALFRILEPASGRIVVDGLNLSDYGLHDIRSKLTIIPQDPVLFSGTLRFNLDPLKLYSDLDIWRSLELAHLKPYINSFQAGLDYKVSEYGENFSVGQRQLICLARAILRKSKILILDEATASVDLETDSIVQKTIREIFSDCTILTIAHRLHTILDSDRILVLDKGRVKELDSPVNLIANSGSEFCSLVRDAGIDKSSILKVARIN